MQVNLSTNYGLFKNTNNEQRTTSTAHSYTQMNELSNISYKDYHLSFGAKQSIAEFDPEKMPETMKQYLFESIEERQKMRPLDLQKEAFAYLNLSETVDDVKSMYGSEFPNLKAFKENKARRGYLADIRMTNSSNLAVLVDSKTDLPVYLLKKIYLEGKTLNQINKDFHNDVRADFKLADGKYFTYADFKSMGVKIPDLKYWHSLLATKDDKTPKNYYGKLLEKRHLSDETKEKIRQGQLKRYDGMTPDKKKEHALKIVTGKRKSESVFAKYQKDIMTIAINEAGVGSDMSKHFEDLRKDVNFSQKKFATWNDKRSEMFKTFWDKYPEDAQKLSEKILDNIAKFKVAHACGENGEEMQELKNLSKYFKNQSRQKMKLRAKERKAAQGEKLPFKKFDVVKKPTNPEEKRITQDLRIKRSLEIKKLKGQFEAYLRDAVAPMPEGFKRLFIPFLVNHPDMTPEMMDMAVNVNEKLEVLVKQYTSVDGKKASFNDIERITAQIINEGTDDGSELSKYLKSAKDIEDGTKVINNIFDAKNFTLHNSAEQALNETVYSITKFPTVMGFSRAECINYINQKNIRAEVMNRKQEINNAFVEYQKGISKPLLNSVFEQNIIPMVPRMLEVDKEAAKEAFGEHWQKVLERVPSITEVKEERQALFDYIEKVGGRLKFFLKPNTDKVQRDGAAFGLVFDYLAEVILPQVKKLK